MQLKKIEIQGFKSFADRTCIEFVNGITSIVGPNGSGKSNIADSFKWVFGERRLKEVRGVRSDDIIFSGTQLRKPMGFAEVTVIIDNSNGDLPIEFSEVSICRRVFRSGESEYFINKTPCRLKDVDKLFMDTGLGRDGYSIIGQGEIGQILSAKPEEKRGIFEEASGIMKYKSRKEEAERKMESTKQNLERLEDIIQEIEDRLRPLEQQALSAKKYLELKENLKILEVGVYAITISRLKEDGEKYKNTYTRLKNDIDEYENERDKIMCQNQNIMKSIKKLEEEINLIRAKLAEIESNLEKINNGIAIINEKRDNYIHYISKIDLDVEEISSNVCKLKENQAQIGNELKNLKQFEEKYYDEMLKYQREWDIIQLNICKNGETIENLKQNLFTKINIQTDKKIQSNNLKIHIKGLEQRAEDVEQERKSCDNNGLLREGDRLKIGREISEIEVLVRDIDTQYKKMVDEKRRVLEELKKCKVIQDEAKSNLHFSVSKKNALEQIEKNLDGYIGSVKALLRSYKSDERLKCGIHGALAQLISVKKEYEIAIGTALGGSLQNIIASDENDAKLAIEYLKKNKLGRATFLPISAIKARNLGNDILHKLEKETGFCGIAAGLVGCEDKYRQIILNLLGRVVVVDSLQTGIHIARNFDHSFKIVTIDGNVINTGGAMSGGSVDIKDSTILGRRREIAELGLTVEGLVLKEKELNNNIIQYSNELDKISGQIATNERKLNLLQIEKAKKENVLQSIKQELNKINEKSNTLLQEKLQIEQEKKKIHLDLNQHDTSVETCENDILNQKEAIAIYEQKYKEAIEVKEQINKKMTECKVNQSSLTEKIKAVKDRLERLSLDVSTANSAIKRKEEEKANTGNQIEKLIQEKEELTIQLKQCIEKKEICIRQINHVAQNKSSLESQTIDITNKITEINKKLGTFQKEFNQVSSKKAVAEMEYSSFQNKLWEEYELTYSEATDFVSNVKDEKQSHKLINEYRVLIKGLGSVNIKAIEEYNSLRQRQEFMVSERDDLRVSSQMIYKLIREITSIMKDQFAQQIKIISENFNEVFRELFGGGAAQLVMEDEENVLESKIDIKVQPPGKKLQNMMLLSGGEKALSAIALLFAVLRLKPVPFCILDEIEAALDEPNVYRFMEYLKNYVHATQFIIITHRKGTMESSDALFGVTMQDRGISNVVSLKVEA